MGLERTGPPLEAQMYGSWSGGPHDPGQKNTVKWRRWHVKRVGVVGTEGEKDT